MITTLKLYQTPHDAKSAFYSDAKRMGTLAKVNHSAKTIETMRQTTYYKSAADPTSLKGYGFDSVVIHEDVDEAALADVLPDLHLNAG